MHFSASLFLCKHKRALSLIIYSLPRHVAVWHATVQSQEAVLNGVGRNWNLVNFVFLAFAFRRQSTDKPKESHNRQKTIFNFSDKGMRNSASSPFSFPNFKWVKPLKPGEETEGREIVEGVVRDTTFYGERESFPALRAPRKCPFVLMKVGWR